ncbi:MAG: AAA family ATPase [Acidobacteria bacterium]|nr:AAA family ATPase [Acidobacteriota bacterium]
MSTLLETLSSYVPSFVVYQAAKNPTYFTKPTKEKLISVVLFADISGFTALTERLAKRGPAGAEELTHLLNNYLGQLIDLIYLYGGDIVKFAGDALLAIWPTELLDTNLEKLTQKVAQCCLVIQERLHNYPVASDVNLSMKLAIGAGEILIQTLGGIFGRWEFLVAGSPLTQVGICNKYAKSGQILISPEAWNLIKENSEVLISDYDGEQIIQLTKIRNAKSLQPTTKIKATASTTAAIRAFIPGAIRSRIDAGQTDWLAELRKITVLFINLPDFNHKTSLEQAQEAMCALQTSLYRYEGSINKISVDDKGASLVAALGLPPLSHEDDAARGVRAALAMQETLKNLGLRSSIGVTSGLTFCGSVGSSLRREYTVMGDTVNLAARLMQAATDDILCDDLTAKAAFGRLNFTPLAPLKVKGKIDPIAIYRPSLLKTKKAKTTINKTKIEIIGRSKEKALLKEKLQLLKQNHQGSRLIIEGEAGIGKSRLVEEIILQAQEMEILLLQGAGDSIESATPYFAWRNIVTEFFQLDSLENSDNSTKETHILRQLPSDPKLLQNAPLLDVFLPWDWPDNEYTSQLIGKVRADNLHETLVSLLKHYSKENPLVVIMEDAHWLDSGSLALLLQISQQVEDLLLIVATRPLAEPIAADYKQLESLVNTEKVELSHLSTEQTIALVSRRLGVKNLPKEVQELIISKSDGNPFFSEELAYAMRDMGYIQVVDGQCLIAKDVGEVNTWKFPDTIQGIITSRVDRLTPAQQLTIKVASVIGRVFPFRTLQDIYPIDRDREFISDHFQVLEALDLTPLDRPAPDLAYIFKHIITRDVVYNLMLFSQRRQLHRAVAEWYEKVYASDLSPYYSYLAFHWCKAAQDHEPEPELVYKAIDYLQKAGEQAVQRYVNQEAIGFFSEALELINSLPQTKERAKKELELQLAMGAPVIATKGYAAQEVLTAYSKAQKLCEELGDNKLLFPALRGLWAFYIGRADYLTATSLAEKLLKLAEEENDPAIILEAYRAMGNAVFWCGELVLAQQNMEEGIKLYTQNEHRTLAFLYGQDPDVANRGMQSWPLSLMGYPEQALKRAQEAITEATQLSHPYSLGYALVHTACCYHYLLQVDLAYQMASEAVKLAQEKGFPNWLLAGMVVQGWALVYKGDTNNGIALVEQALDFWRSSGSELVIPYFLTTLADCYNKAGRLSDALKTLNEAFIYAEKNTDLWYEAEMYRLKGMFLVESSNITQAEEAFIKAINVAKNQQSKLLQLRATISLAELWQKQGKKQAAIEKLSEIYRWFTEGFQMPDLKAARLLLK